MPMDSVSEESVEKLMKEKDEKEVELDILAKMNITDIWLNELNELKKEYMKFIHLDNHQENKDCKKSIIIKKKKKSN